jgi:AraC family transcriptional regulator of adaptative response/methylated-DNA-[protein]-cysteine methyltransferase
MTFWDRPAMLDAWQIATGVATVEPRGASWRNLRPASVASGGDRVAYARTQAIGRGHPPTVHGCHGARFSNRRHFAMTLIFYWEAREGRRIREQDAECCVPGTALASSRGSSHWKEADDMTTKIQGVAAAVMSDPRWVAVAARDAGADGAFVYSVETTGVYCRPSCAARAARPEHVAFHATAADAERAGFRPCKRCKPDQPPLAERRAAQVADLCRLIERSDVAPTLDALARRAGLSAFHTQRIFKAVTGVTPRAYAKAHRARRVQSELRSRGSVTEAIYGAGYGSSGRFYEESRDLLGMTPTGYRAGGAGQEIRFAVGECSLGSILVAATERGVCAILLGDDPEELVHDLERRFRRAELVGGDAGFEQLVARVVGLVERPHLGHDLPLDIRGTAFQRRVWEALRGIPAGSTTSYAAIAASIGAPGAVRAVAGACAANPLAVAIPCHRVVRNDGALSGYRWGVERKRTLLEREAIRAESKPA